MAYTRKYFLHRVKAVNEIYKENTKRGATNEWIYEHLIKDVYHISRSTFYEYLTIPYASQLREIEKRESLRAKQEPTLF